MQSLQRHTYTWGGIADTCLAWWAGIGPLVIGTLFLRRGLQLRRAWMQAETDSID